MKTQSLSLILAILAATGSVVQAQGPVIRSFQSHGQLEWTNTVNSNAIYRIEWASETNGPWHAFTYQPINTIDAHGETIFSAAVPVFYRVVMVTNEPPAGMVWIDGGDVELGQIGIATPVHTNFVSGFWMDAKEATKELWNEVGIWALMNGYGFDNAGGAKTNNHPIIFIKRK